MLLSLSHSVPHHSGQNADHCGVEEKGGQQSIDPDTYPP